MESNRNHPEELKHLSKLSHLPLLSNQRRLWILSQQNKTNPAYNIVLTYHFKGEINVDIFQKSIDRLFHRQHTIFSVFKQEKGVPYIEIIPGPVTIDLIDFSDLPIQTRKEEILSFAGKDSRKCFDIEKGPLYRLYLLKEDNASYFFYAAIHHLIFDGWSRRVFVQEISTIYNSMILNTEVTLEPLRLHSYDYAALENRSISVENEEELVEFWANNLKGCQTELKFPYDYLRKSDPTGLGCRESFEISKECTFKLRELSKKTDTTLFNTMVSIVGVLLQKYSGENDICIGIPLSNRRSHSSLDKIFGLFISTLVVRLKIDGKNSFKDHIRYARDVVRNAISHSKLPFDKIVEAVSPERISGINPLFQVSLSWLNDLTIPIDFERIKGERVTLAEGVSPFDITFYIWEEGDQIHAEIEFNIDILKRATIVRLRDNFLTLINELIENPEISLDLLPIICEEERKEVLSFSGTRTEYPKNKSITQLFEEQVKLYPDKLAVVFKDESITYYQLNKRTNQLARTLRELEIKNNIPVGILVEKSLDMIVGILGILKAGGTYVPLDPEYPEQRLNFMIKDSGCKVLLTQGKYMKSPAEGIRKINLSSPDSYHKEYSDFENIYIPSDLAYIMYTSGTTGIPKGSMITQQGVIRLVRNTNYIELTPKDKILLTGAIVFDAITFEIWGVLLNGGSLYIAEKDTILNPRALGEELIKNNITILWLTSPLFTQIAEARTDIFAKLKYLLVGGDVLSAPHINKVRKDNPQLKVINGYGPTENTTFSTTFLIEKDFDRNIPIGKPISNSTAYIFDRNMNYQPIGILGELFVGGDGLSTGYLNRDDLNRNSFIDHPHIHGERIYRTGDYARWLPDGNIEFHGRIDNQLKIRGFRVELEEVECAISEMEGVIETVIKPFKIEEGDIRLVAFLNVSDTFNMDTRVLCRKIKERLPHYMVPSAIKLLHGFPKTINGKIDKDALIFDINDLISRESDESKAFTPTEKKIYEIWCEALRIKNISRIDNFFEIGGNSLIVIYIHTKIESAFNVRIGLRTFFDSPRIKDLAENVDIEIQKLAEHRSHEKKDKTDSKIVKAEILFSEFLTELKQKNIKVSFVAGKLNYQGPQEHVTPELIKKLITYKRKLISYFWPPECVNIIPVNPEGTKIPFVFFHGENMHYALSNYFGLERPFYGFSNDGSTGEKINHKSVESYARDNINQLLRVLPNGPYFLGGFSFGGILAFEMAVQLQKLGHEVPFIALLDCRSPFAIGPFKVYNNFFKKIKNNFLVPFSMNVLRIIKLIICNCFFIMKKRIPVAMRYFYIVYKYKILCSKYRPVKFNGDILLFKANICNSTDKYLGWETLANKVKPIVLEGTHLSMIRDMRNAEIIVKEIENQIAYINKLTK